MTVLKDRARGDRHLVSALATAPAGTSHRPRRLSCASRTYPSPGPAQRAQVRRASLLPAEASFQFRSEEHTSELQSHLNLVCRLLLEKKKTQQRLSQYDSHTTP